MYLSVLCTDPLWQVHLLRRDEAYSTKDVPGLLKLCRVRELLLVVMSNKDLNLVLVLMLSERGQRLACDMLAPEEELRKYSLYIE